MLSGTHEDMVRCRTREGWTSGAPTTCNGCTARSEKENTVSAVLHMDEHTPHIHATVVPIVTGERRKARKKQAEGKRTYRKKANRRAPVRR